MKITGIYSITCLKSGRAYIGSSANIDRRWKDHRRRLFAGNHHSKFLQRAWDKHTEENFRFDVIEVCEPEALIERENYYIGLFRERAGIFNAAPAAGSTRGLVMGPRPASVRQKISESHFGIRPDEAAREKMRIAAKSRPKISEETRQKFVARMTGRKLPPLSEEHRAAISARHKGKIISPEHRAALSRAHKGRPLSEEHRRKKSEAAKLQHARRRAAKETQSAPG